MNLDKLKEMKLTILQRMAAATRDNDTEAFTQAFSDLADNIRESVMEEFHAAQTASDAAVLASRGVRVLTAEEKTYYEGIIGAMKSENPKQALAGTNTVLPETVINAVFEDLQSEHPLLSAIDFTPTGALTKILLAKNGGVAKWVGLGEDATGAELSAEFIEVDLLAAELISYLPVNKYMLEMGPTWMDSYVRKLLTEALAVQLETGIVAGTGSKSPIGMMKKLSGALDGVYSDKTAVALSGMDAVAFGAVLAKLAVNSDGKNRAVTGVIMVVNPADYFTKVFPAVTPRASDGTFAQNVTPYPCQIIQSCGVPAGKAIVGMGKKYFMGVGTGGEGGKLQYDDSYKFLERQRMYMIHMYGNGRALDENDFVLCDISSLEPYAFPVKDKSKG